MTILSLSVPDSMKAFLEEQVAKGGYGTTDEYLRALIGEAQRRAAQAKLEVLLSEGVDSGEPTPMTDEDWDEMRRRYDERHATSAGP
jgi:antitoxin ParD1/3/4